MSDSHEHNLEYSELTVSMLILKIKISCCKRKSLGTFYHLPGYKSAYNLINNNDHVLSGVPLEVLRMIWSLAEPALAWVSTYWQNVDIQLSRSYRRYDLNGVLNGITIFGFDFGFLFQVTYLCIKHCSSSLIKQGSNTSSQNSSRSSSPLHTSSPKTMSPDLSLLLNPSMKDMTVVTLPATLKLTTSNYLAWKT
ncbi:hypothetical protein OSB04_028790 [Centaurea solstitialis]|uniref:Uncharacterized protein n=1 Tax=Centaurea solstitialis TaxID=347529 RepID=A0AA38W9M0_9ASTR|nr:hypothetical protein OSB04_028790 [Centaurea solstitialis]